MPLLIEHATTDREYKLWMESAQYNREKLKKAKEYGDQIMKENDQLKEKTRELNKHVRQCREEIKQAEEENLQKKMDALKKEDHKKIVNVLKAEFELHEQEVDLLKKKFEDEKKHQEQIISQTIEEKMAFEQRKVELKKKQDDLQDFKKKKADLMEECKTLAKENNKAKEYVIKFKSDFEKLEERYKALQLNEAQKLDRMSPQSNPKCHLENQKLRKTIGKIAKHANDSKKTIKQNAQFLKDQHVQIVDLKRRLSIQRRKMTMETPKCEPPEFVPEPTRSPPLVTDIPHTSHKKIVEKKLRQKKWNPNTAEKEFFFLTCMAVKMTSGQNMDETLGVSVETLWKKCLEQKVQFHQFHNWIDKQITEIYVQSRFKIPKKIIT